jgi:GT2 family glycosyltransferase
MRFIVKRSSKPLCCVKRLPLDGPYDPQAILATQKAYHALSTVKVPEVLNSAQDQRNWFIIEQFVQDGTRLDDAVRRQMLSRSSAEKLVARILAEIYSNTLGEPDRSVDENRIVSAIQASRLTSSQKDEFQRQIFEADPLMWHAPVWTSRDFLPRNILLSEGQPYLVDFDLACKTGLLGMDVLRIEFYTGWNIPFWPDKGARRDDPRTHLLFMLMEEHLQQTVAAGAHYRYWIDLYEPQIQQLVHRVFGGATRRGGKFFSVPSALVAGKPQAQKTPRRGSRASRLHRAADSVTKSFWATKHQLEVSASRIFALRAGLGSIGDDLLHGRPRRSFNWTAVANSPIKYWIDVPGEWTMPEESTLVSGWCYCPGTAISAVRVRINGQVHRGYYGGERRDVKAALDGELDTPNIGFAIQCSVQRGFNHVVIEAECGKRWVPLARSVWRTAYFPGLRRQGHPNYQQYVETEQRRLNRCAGQYARQCSAFANQPLISIVMPVYKSDVDLLSRAVESVRRQIYSTWELCIVDDGSHRPELTRFLDELADDKRIKIHARESNGNISIATNEAIYMATGQWIGFLDHDDELAPDALYHVVARINEKPDCDVIYTDQDKIDRSQRRSEPFFKPDWSPVYFRGVMYLGHFLAVRREVMHQVGGCNSIYDGVQDYELALRISEKTQKIEHIARVLYHWRAISGSVAADPQAKDGIEALQEQAVQAHLDRMAIPATARRNGRAHRVNLLPRPRASYPKISILIPTRDHPELIGRCLKTLYRLTNYPDFEVLIGDNETSDPRALKIFESYPIRKVALPGGFHFAQFMNVLAAQATGEYLMLLNNDTEIIQTDWLQHLLLHAQAEDVGMAGATLTYADGTTQHAGIILGPRGTADHVMRGFPSDCDGYFGSMPCSREVTAVTAAGAMISRRKFMLVGGFSERFRRHYDDLDFCLRLRAMGWRNICVASARLVHYESRSRGLKYDFTDRILLLDRWEKTIDHGDPFYNPNFHRDSTDYRLDVAGAGR